MKSQTSTIKFTHSDRVNQEASRCSFRAAGQVAGWLTNCKGRPLSSAACDGLHFELASQGGSQFRCHIFASITLGAPTNSSNCTWGLFSSGTVLSAECHCVVPSVNAHPGHVSMYHRYRVEASEWRCRDPEQALEQAFVRSPAQVRFLMKRHRSS